MAESLHPSPLEEMFSWSRVAFGGACGAGLPHFGCSGTASLMKPHLTGTGSPLCSGTGTEENDMIRTMQVGPSLRHPPSSRGKRARHCLISVKSWLFQPGGAEKNCTQFRCRPSDGPQALLLLQCQLLILIKTPPVVVVIVRNSRLSLALVVVVCGNGSL